MSMKADEEDIGRKQGMDLVEELASMGPFSNPTRVGIMVVLLALRRATFTDILMAVKISKSSLNSSLNILERNGYVKIEHGFLRMGGPRTIVKITEKGEDEITRYLKFMNRFTNSVMKRTLNALPVQEGDNSNGGIGPS